MSGGAFVTWDGKSRNRLQRHERRPSACGNGIMASKYESYGDGNLRREPVPDGVGVIVTWTDL
jgi:hypothetical protein